MIDYIFYLCVDILAWMAKVTGTTYEFINILIFIIGYPLFVIILITVIYLIAITFKLIGKPYGL